MSSLLHPDFFNLSQRDREKLLIEQAVAEGRVQRLPPRKNKAFSAYLYSSAKAASQARGASKRTTGHGARARFDLAVQELHDRAGEEGTVPFKDGTWREEWRPLNDD